MVYNDMNWTIENLIYCTWVDLTNLYGSVNYFTPPILRRISVSDSDGMIKTYAFDAKLRNQPYYYNNPGLIIK